MDTEAEEIGFEGMVLEVDSFDIRRKILRDLASESGELPEGSRGLLIEVTDLRKLWTTPCIFGKVDFLTRFTN